MLSPFRGHPYPNGAMLYPFRAMLYPYGATPSSFVEHRDALAALPTGLRETRRVLGAAPWPPLGLLHEQPDPPPFFAAALDERVTVSDEQR